MLKDRLRRLRRLMQADMLAELAAMRAEMAGMRAEMARRDELAPLLRQMESALLSIALGREAAMASDETPP